MRRVEYHRYWLPPRPGSGPRAKPYLSSWPMDAEAAAKLGAIRPEPSTREVRELPETEAERARSMAHYQGAGRDGAKPPPRNPSQD